MTQLFQLKRLLIGFMLLGFISCTTNEGPTMSFNPDKPNGNDGTEEPGEDNRPGGDTAVSMHMATPENSPELFTIREEFSEDFGANGATTFDPNKWESYDDNGFAAWTFFKENVTIAPDEGNNPETKEDALCVTAKYEPHKRNNSNFEFYFKSGILRSKKPVKYGYYEARLKGSNVWPGTCSAFWLYSIVDKDAIMPRQEGTIVYNEIDIMEIQQIASNQRMMASNVHLMYLKENGKVDGNGNPLFSSEWAKASKMPNLAQTQYEVDWYADDDYHIYACENRPDSIVFYLDNKRVGGKANYYWHMDEGMYITFSLGMRTPFEAYVDGIRQPKAPETQEEIDQFPTSMYVDYIKSYERDYSNFRNNQKDFSPNDMQ